jgi:hypothetical protein
MGAERHQKEQIAKIYKNHAHDATTSYVGMSHTGKPKASIARSKADTRTMTAKTAADAPPQGERSTF